MNEGLVNESPFAAQELFLADEDGRDLLAVVVKATYTLRPDTPLELSDEQISVNLAGTYYGDPAESSARFEPEVAFVKPGVDVVLVGHAVPDRPGVRAVDVGFQLGPIRKTLRVFGDRYWTSRLGVSQPSDPAPIERVPLVWERAFGGWDRRAADPAEHAVERRNPVGIGFQKKRSAPVEGAPVPNLEDPRALIEFSGDAPSPAGFGFVGPHWEPRARYAGTYDDVWQQTRMPLLPTDFDRRFFNAAPADQIASELRGDEPVMVANASLVPWLTFRLPGEPPPRVDVAQQTGDTALEMRLDTVILDTDAMQVVLLWRAHTLLSAGPHGVAAIRVRPHEQSAHAEPEPVLVPAS